MPGLFVSAQDLASIAVVKPAFTHQRVSLILSNPTPVPAAARDGWHMQIHPLRRGRNAPPGVAGSHNKTGDGAHRRDHHLPSEAIDAAPFGTLSQGR